jgi:hypothetical protein
VLGRETASALQAILDSELRDAAPVDREAWSHRPLGDRLEERFSRIWQSLL